MLGLNRGDLLLVPHQEDWEKEYEREKERILGTLKSIKFSIAHIGSTSIPGIAAKPVIDIALELESHESLASIVPVLQSLGYEYFGDRRSDGDYFFANGLESRRTHYLHVSVKGTMRYANYLRFRDKLRGNRELAVKYDRLKSELVKKFQTDRKSYTQAKETFIRDVPA